MKYRFLSALTLFFLLISIISCDRPNCTSNNQIFNDNQPNSETYKQELASELSKVNQSELTYWLKKYDQVNNQEYLHFYIQGDGLCATMVLTMNQWDKLEKVREKKGVTFRGAQFTNLTFDIQQDSLATKFIYNSFDSIID